ncbi:MAG: MerR family transcriptional regulator [Polyangiales bacterium]
MAQVEIPAKVYFRIGEVARLLEVPTHVLRFWETEFRSVRPQKSRAGQRVYSRKDVERLLLIRRLLKEERYTLEGARKILRERGFDAAEASPEAPPPRSERLRAALESAARGLRDALQALPAASDPKSNTPDVTTVD